jgi:hypothetical protein
MSLPLGGYPQYVPLTPTERYRNFSKIIGFLREYAEKTKNFDHNDIQCRQKILFEIIERVEKRRVYFSVFHGITMSEQNETCLYCFWIAKLAPFFDGKNPDHPINAFLASFMFLRMLYRVGRKIRYDVTVDRYYTENLVYAFLYRDLSKEAIMAMAEAMLVGASTIDDVEKA